MSTETLIRRADQARDERDWRAAARAYSEALEHDPRRAPIWVQYGHALKENGDVVEAEAAYRRAIELADEVADTYLQLGHALKLQSRNGEACDAYLAALHRDQSLVDAREELVRLGWSTTQIRQRLRELTIDNAGRDTRISPSTFLALEITDLVHHILSHGLILSGIQRVQFAVLRELLDSEAPVRVTILTYVGERRHWVEIPHGLARGLVNPGARYEVTLRELRLDCAAGEPYRFEPGTALLNLGTSWWLPDYFLALRNARQAGPVRLYHFIHDLGPVLHPEFCLPDLVPAFLSWLVEIAAHADCLLINSQSTQSDVTRVFDGFGLAPPPLRLVRLDGLVSGFAVDVPSPPRSLAALGIQGDFVLFVSTFEARKNHLFAFAGWHRLLSERGPARTPLLVCVGRRDWAFDEINRARLADPALGQRIRMLTDISDTELAKLYEQCRFLVYPSHYEGWGLPVSEALGHGKVPLVARVAALPEAGGEFAEYFDPANADDFDQKLRRLIDDVEYRKEREQNIAEGYRSISAGEVVQGLVQQIIDDQSSVSPSARSGDFGSQLSPVLPLDVYLPLARNRESELSRVVRNGAVYRIGLGWEPPDEQGCLFRGSDAQLRMRLAEGQPCALYLICERVVGHDVQLSVEPDPGGSWSGKFGQQQHLSIPVRLAPDREGECTVRLRLSGDTDPKASPIRLLGLFAFRKTAEGRPHSEDRALNELSKLTRSVITEVEVGGKLTRQQRLEHFKSAIYGHVEGWLGDRMASVVEMLGSLLDRNNVRGHIAEFGVHHGLFLFLLNAIRHEDELCFAIDIFENQNLNIDSSGKGSLQTFQNHLQKLLPTERTTFTIVQRDTLSFSLAEFSTLFAPRGVKFLSIDGGHTIHHSSNDLQLAQEVLVPGGIVALDDYMSAHWPGVTEGFYTYMTSMNRRLKPLFYFQNKLFLTTISERPFYFTQLRTAICTRFADEVRQGRWKEVSIAGSECLSFE